MWIVIIELLAITSLLSSVEGMDEKITNEYIISNQWSLHSAIFSITPKGGFNIVFLDNGKVNTTNLADVRKWNIQNNMLILTNDDNSTLYEFRIYKSDKGVMQAKNGDVKLYIALAGKYDDGIFK